MGKKTAKDFSRKEIYGIAKSYSEGTYTYEAFIREYGCSQNTFYSIIDAAVVKNIVPDEIVDAIEIVSVSNSYNKLADDIYDDKLAMRAVKRGRKSNMSRRLERKNYYLPKSEAISMINSYIASDLPQAQFCKRYYITTSAFGKTLKNAIVKSWINLKTVEQLRLKAQRNNDPEKVNKLFDALLSQRSQYKTAKQGS